MVPNATRTTSGSLVRLVHGEAANDNENRPDSIIRYTGENTDLCSIQLPTSASDEGNVWFLFNDTDHTWELRGETASGREITLLPSDADNTRHRTMQAGEFAMVVCHQYAETGASISLYRTLGVMTGVTAGSNITITGDPRNPTISADMSGAGNAPTLAFSRTSPDTLADTYNDNTFVFSEVSGGEEAVINLPNVSASNIGRRLTVMNRRTDVNATVRLALASGDGLQSLVGDLTLNQGDAVGLIGVAADQWAVVWRGSIPTFPQFTSSAGNGTNAFQFGVTGSGTVAFNRDLNRFINLNYSGSGTVDYSLPDPSSAAITLADGDGYAFQNINSQSWSITPEATSTLVVDGTTYNNTTPFTLASNMTLVVQWSVSQNRYNGTLFNRILFSAGGTGAGAVGSADVVEGVRTITSDGLVIDSQLTNMDVEFEPSGASGTWTWHFSGTGQIPNGKSINVTIANRGQHSIVMQMPGSLLFDGTGCNKIVVMPGAEKVFTVYNREGIGMVVRPRGPIEYEFVLPVGDYAGSDPTVSAVPDFLSDLFTASGSSLAFATGVSGLLDLRVEADMYYSGATGTFGDLLAADLTPLRSGSVNGSVADFTFQRVDGLVQEHFSREWSFNMASADAVTFSNRGFGSNNRLRNVVWRCKAVLKM